MRKRLLAIVMSAAMVLSLVPSLAFAYVADPADRVEHTCTWSEGWQNICGKDGTVLGTVEEEDEIDTCDFNKYKAHVCTDPACDKYDVDTAKLLGEGPFHQWNDGVDRENCVETWTLKTCQRDDCDVTVKVNVETKEEPAEHDWNTTADILEEATCTTDAKVGYTCKNTYGVDGSIQCDAVKDVETVKGSAKGHDIDAPEKDKDTGEMDYSKADKAKSVAASCYADGKYVYVCKRGCGYEEEYAIPKTEKHVYKDTADIIKLPTCATPGYKAYCCNVEGCPAYRGEYKYTEATGQHSWVEVDGKTVDATCTEDGSVTKKCSVCKETKVETIKATGHEYAKVRETVKPATCTEAEILAFPCVNEDCDSYSSPIEGEPARGHADVEDLEWSIARPTCTETACAVKYCNHIVGYEEDDEDVESSNDGLVPVYCDEILAKRELTEEEISKLDKYEYEAYGHFYDLKTIENATCSKEGKKVYRCYCGDVKEVTITKLPHTVVDIPAVAATYTKTGLTKGQKCSVCDETVLAQTTVAKKVLAQAKTPTVKAGKGYIKVSYKAVKDATGYQIVVKRSGEKKVVTVKSAKAATKTIKKLKSGKTYKVYVRAYRTEGKTTVYGKYAPAKSIKVK